MERWTVLVGGAVAVTVAAGTFAVVRAVATDEPLAPPPTVVAPTSPTAPAGSSAVTDSAPAGSSAGTAAASEAVEIEIAGFEFSPAELTVAVGTEVTWVNSDGTDHSIISTDGSVVSPPLGDGDTFSFTFATPGVYTYICGFHPEMTGTITVEG